MATTHETALARKTNREKLWRAFRSVFAEIDAFVLEEDEAKREKLQERLTPLGVTRSIEWTIPVARGGPEYGFTLSYDPASREWTAGQFYWADWFAYEEQSLCPGEIAAVVEAYGMDSLPH